MQTSAHTLPSPERSFQSFAFPYRPIFFFSFLTPSKVPLISFKCHNANVKLRNSTRKEHSTAIKCIEESAFFLSCVWNSVAIPPHTQRERAGPLISKHTSKYVLLDQEEKQKKCFPSHEKNRKHFLSAVDTSNSDDIQLINLISWFWSSSIACLTMQLSIISWLSYCSQVHLQCNNEYYGGGERQSLLKTENLY